MSMLLRRRRLIAPAALLTALIAAAFVVALPAVVSAQPPPPHLFFGQVADITVNGAPWDGLLIEVVDEDGDVVATVDRDGDAWTAFVPPDAGSVRFRRGDAVSQSFAISGGSLTQIALVLVDGGPGRTVALVSGFNFIVWTGATMSVDDALASFPNLSRLDAIFEFDSATQLWDSFRPGSPAFLQKIDELVAGGAYFFSMTGSVSWQMPVDGVLGGTQTIAAGFTAIGWVGADGDSQDLLDAIANAGAITVVFRFNAQTQGYDQFRPGVDFPPPSIVSVGQYDVFFIQASSATSITQ